MDLCLFGSDKAGKTSLVKVVFEKKINPQETIMLESTKRMEITEVKRGLMEYKVIDYPSCFLFKDMQPAQRHRLDKLGALIYVLNLQNDPLSFEFFIQETKCILDIRPNVTLHIFLHKADTESYDDDERKTELLSQAKKKLSDQLEMEGLDWKIEFYLTSIYDYSMVEGFSKVIQGLIPQAPYLNEALNCLRIKCKFEKAFIFDVFSKLYLATDNQDFNQSTLFYLCSEMIDVFMDISFSGKKERKPQAKSVIVLNYGGEKVMLVLHEIHKFFAIVCILKQTSYVRPFVIDHNIDTFRKGVITMFEP